MLVVALSYATVSQGAFYAHQFRVLAVLVGVALVVALLRRPVAAGPRHPLPLVLGGLAVVGLASAWSAGAVPRAAPTLAFLAVASAAFAVARRTPPAEREAVVVAVVALAVFAAASGVAAVAFRRAPLALVDGGLWRASSTLTYANATAGFLLVPLFLALGRVVLGAASAAWSLAAYVLVTGLVATLSRGGMLALVAGAVVLAASVGPRRAAARSWPVFAGAAVAALGLAPGMPDRLPARPALAVLGVAAGAAVVLAARRPGRGRTAVAVAVVVAAAAAAGVAAALGAGGDLASARLTASSPDRLDGWAAAVDVLADRPALGAGPGNATYAYVDGRGDPMVTRFVHNEYLQVLAETGLAGGSVVAAGVGLTLRRLRRRSGPAAPTGAGALAGLAAFCVHSALDFLWHVPVVLLAAIVIVGITADRVVRTDVAPGPGVGAPSAAS